MEPDEVKVTKAKVYDSEWDVDAEHEGVEDWVVSTAGYLTLNDAQDNTIALYAPGTWSKVEFTRA